MALRYPADLLALVACLKKLPGVGSRTAERFACQLLSWPQQQLDELSALIASVKERVPHCAECNCWMEGSLCPFCQGVGREAHTLCIIASAKDAYAFEETRAFRGLYHAIGGLLSPLDGRMPEHLLLTTLKTRIERLKVREAIIALDSTLEGDATALYLREHLSQWGIAVSRLAFGLPMGSPLDFIDGGTLAQALAGRQAF